MTETGPGSAHRHKNSSNKWSDKTDVESGSLHIPKSTTSGQDVAGQVTAFGQLPSPVVIPAGQLEVRLSCAAGTLYTACPIRDGVDVGFDPSLAWPYGQFQTSSDDGATWKDVYPGLDLQWGGQ